MRRAMRPNQPRAARGFSLIELAVSLVVLGLIALLVLALIPRVTDRMRLDDGSERLAALTRSVDGFAIDQHRLPCPDLDGNGIEDRTGDVCDDSVGGLPWQDLGLSEQARDDALRPLRYAVYRSAADDLARLTQLFEPNLPDDLDIVPGTVTGCDSDGDYVLVAYEADDSTTFVLNDSAGFQVDEYVGLGIMDYENLATNVTQNPCPCGGVDGISCTACTVFPTDSYVLGANSGDATQVASTTIPGDPGQFHSYFPGGSFSIPEPLTGADASGLPNGITADGTGYVVLLAQVVDIDGNNLKVDVLDSLSSSGFAIGDSVTGGTSGATATVTGTSSGSISADVTSGNFVSGETITNGASGTATVSSITPPNYIATITAGTPAVGDILTSNNSTQSTVQSVNEASIEINITSGTAQAGDVVTGGTSGAVGVVSSAGATSVANVTTPGFLVGETVSLSPSTASGTVTTVFDEVLGLTDTGTGSGEINPGDTVTGGGTSANVTSSTNTETIRATETSVIGGSGFAAGMEIHGGNSGAREDILNIIPPSNTSFAVGETVSAGGASGTVVTAGSNWVLLDNVSGSFTIGEVLTGTTPNAGGPIVIVEDDATAIPTATAGSFTRTPTVSDQLNRLDFCQNMRNAHGATVLAGNASAAVANTVTESTIRVNPAYLLASGGVENADGDDSDIAFDERNKLAPDPLDFNSPAIERRPGYDDVVDTMPIEVLEGRLECSRNISAVNAKAVSATAMKNNLLANFWLNEQAIRNVEISYQSWQMAIVDQRIAIAQVTLDAISTALGLYKDLMYTEGKAPAEVARTAAFIAAAAVGITTTAVAVGELVTDAGSAVSDAQDTFEASCVAQQEAFDRLAEADVLAEQELQEALRIDELGGVK